MATYSEKEGLMRQYDVQKWAKQTKVGKRTFIWKFFMRGKEIPGWTLTKTIPEQIYEDRRILTYMWQKTEGDEEELIKIDVVESPSWRQAHETLLELLGKYQALQLPEAASRNIEIGDVAFVGFGETIQSAIFARANMIVRIHGVGKQDVSIVNTAKQIDELFVSRPQLSKKGVVPEIESFSSDRRSAKINEIVTLSMRAKEPLDRPLWYKFIVNQGELFVRDEKVCFSSKTPGQPEISLFVVNENGFIAGTALSIIVE